MGKNYQGHSRVTLILREDDGALTVLSEKSEVAKAPARAPINGQEPPAQNWAGERFPQTRLRWLQDQDVDWMSYGDVRYAINEMFARHGATFNKDAIQNVFRSKSWYRPRHGLSFDEIEYGSFSNMERSNLKVLGRHRNRMK